MNIQKIAISLATLILSATLHATPAQVEFRKEQQRMANLPTTSDATLVKSGQYRFAIGARTINSALSTIQKTRSDPKYMPNNEELSYLKIAAAVAVNILNNQSGGNSESVFGNPETLDENNAVQRKLKMALEADKNLRFLKENLNVTYNIQKRSLAGWAPDGIKLLFLSDIMQTVNHVDSLLGK